MTTIAWVMTEVPPGLDRSGFPTWTARLGALTGSLWERVGVVAWKVERRREVPDRPGLPPLVLDLQVGSGTCQTLDEARVTCERAMEKEMST